MHEFSKQAASHERTFWKAFKAMLFLWTVITLMVLAGVFLLTYYLLKYLGVI